MFALRDSRIIEIKVSLNICSKLLVNFLISTNKKTFKFQNKRHKKDVEILVLSNLVSMSKWVTNDIYKRNILTFESKAPVS